jgi:hypothetical protein
MSWPIGMLKLPQVTGQNTIWQVYNDSNYNLKILITNSTYFLVDYDINSEFILSVSFQNKFEDNENDDAEIQ